MARPNFDARIFNENDIDHPGGWGTVLAVDEVRAVLTMSIGMRSLAMDQADRIWMRMRSSLVLFDVTNPEQPPQLMAELTDDQLGDFFTTSQPALIRNHQAGWSGLETPATNDWSLVFGAGPTGLSAATA